MKTIITFGTFDVFHIGHLRILQRAGQLGRPIVGISSGCAKYAEKGRCRFTAKAIVWGLWPDLNAWTACSSKVAGEKADYIRQFNADTLVMGRRDDWAGRF